MSKHENFFNLRWLTVAILKIVFGHNSATDCLISVKFSMGNSIILLNRKIIFNSSSTVECICSAAVHV